MVYIPAFAYQIPMYVPWLLRGRCCYFFRHHRSNRLVVFEDKHIKLSFRHHLKSLSGVMQPEIALEFMHADSQRFTNQQFPALPEKRQRPRECHPQRVAYEM